MTTTGATPPGSDGQPGNPDAGALSIVDGRGRVNGGNVTIAKAGTGLDRLRRHHGRHPASPGRRRSCSAPRTSNNGYMWQLHADDNALKTHRMVAGAFPTDARRTVPHVIDTGVTYELSVRGRGPDSSRPASTARSSTPGPTRHRPGRAPAPSASARPAARSPTSTTSGSPRSTARPSCSPRTSPAALDQWVRGTTDAGGRRVHARPHRGRRPGRRDRPRPQLSRGQPHRRALPRRRARRPGQQLRLPGRGLLPGHRRHRPGHARRAAWPSAAMLHWFSGGQGRAAASSPGLLARIVVEYADGSEYVRRQRRHRGRCVAGPTSSSAPATARACTSSTSTAPPAGRSATGRRVGYDDAAWSDAVVIGTHPAAPFTHLEGQQTRLTETRRAPRADPRSRSDGTPVADFGKVIPARPGVHFEQGVAGRVITIRASYGLAANGRVSTSGVDTQGTNMSFPYTQARVPRTTRPSATSASATSEIPGAGEEITVDDVTATVVHTAYPEDGAATFESSRRDPGRGVGPDGRGRWSTPSRRRSSTPRPASRASSCTTPSTSPTA